MKPHSASERQIQASHPQDSVWLSANAGSGKTRVLTDRVARLLLGGVEPQNILCLTYTKAAATEMQNRLFRRLGEWAMKPDADLANALAELGNEGRPSNRDLGKARQLFARAIETPGGLRIQTIHSFCAALLRRFPLEAGVSPQFTELDDRASRLLRDSIVEELAEFRAPELMSEIARIYTGEDFAALMNQVASNRAGFATFLDETSARHLFGVPETETIATILADVFLGSEAGLLTRITPFLLQGGTSDIKLAERLANVNFDAPGITDFVLLEDVLLTGQKSKSPFTAKVGAIPNKATRAALSDHMEPFENLMLRVEAARPRRLALNAALKTAALHRFAQAFLPLYEDAKSARGLLDFDDLIIRAKMLLTDDKVAAWVLFRLDGGIDHVLVDEAQDTSPDQWRVIELLTAEFTAGEGAQDANRTLFVVGDKKQSIYSFQGADVAAFDQKSESFRDKFLAAQRNFVPLELEYSFRSSNAILRIVDDTFGNRFPQALGDKVRHLAFRHSLPGRVDLWPLIPKSAETKDKNWEDPIDLVSEAHHSSILAEQIASRLRDMIDAGTQIPTENGSRPMHAGDVLILVQRRSVLFAEIIRACKKAGLPIAGADRLKLGAELAVKDLAALLVFLATPEDDLALAALLRSPLCGWTEAELFALAHGRKGYLWESLRESDQAPETLEMLHDLRDQADYLRPFDLIERALTRHHGRQRLLTRLGPEAEDGIDELLSQALAFERNEIPSLTGFLTWLETDDIEIKRQMDSEGHRIRVMTVHGAKGLEAPVVILPDTADRKFQDRNEIYTTPGGTPIWKTVAEESPELITSLRRWRQEKDQEESLRLLYVALTRAKVWLVVCAAGEAKSETSWYQLVAQGIQTAGCEQIDGGILRYAFGEWPKNAPNQSLTQQIVPVLPEVFRQKSPDAPRQPQPLSPSDLGGAKVLAGEPEGIDGIEAKARGTALHLLLEHLPGRPEQDWPEIARRLVPDAVLLGAVFPEATKALRSSDLARIFGPEAMTEVAFSAELDGRKLQGAIDRLLIEADRVLAVDFKSNHRVPHRAEDTPEGLLRQMGAYAHALQQIYPERDVEVAILWTKTAELMRLDPDIVSAALGRYTIP